MLQCYILIYLALIDMDDHQRMIIGARMTGGGESSEYEQNEGDSSLSNARDSRLLGFYGLNDRTIIRKPQCNTI